MISVGQKIKRRRKELNISATKLAETIGVNRSIISRWETDKKSPIMRHIVNISKALGVNPNYFTNWDDTDNTVEYSTKTIGERIKIKRNLKNMTIEELAEKVGISLSNMSMIENDKLYIHKSIKYKLIDALDIDEKDFERWNKEVRDREDLYEIKLAAKIHITKSHYTVDMEVYNEIGTVCETFNYCNKRALIDIFKHDYDLYSIDNRNLNEERLNKHGLQCYNVDDKIKNIILDKCAFFDLYNIVSLDIVCILDCDKILKED